ncbi:MAG: hypothetical protein AUJ55_13340 [Proteobacteria bacterium CG1_02_64_396]|nr:MAG: hypothetical protein AUJ55_13340 [Proteobacteria bacterium CG1_02_64_396]
MSEHHWDAIVVGGGLGGLTAGALCAIEGMRVLVLERHDKVGGAATVYRRKHLDIEVGLHELDGLDAEDFKLRLWRKLDLERWIEPISEGVLYEVRHGDHPPVVMPEGFEPAIQALSAQFPDQAVGIHRYFDTLRTIQGAMKTLTAEYRPAGWWFRDLPRALVALIPNVRQSLDGLLRDCFGDDPRLPRILAANLLYYADDPRKMALPFYAAAQGSFHRGGGHYLKGGSQRLSDTLAAIVVDNGGQVRTRRQATRLLIDQGRIAGVAHEHAPLLTREGPPPPPTGEDPQTDTAPVVLGNAAPQVLADLLPEPQASKLRGAFQGRAPSISLWALYLGFDRPPADFGVAHYATFVLPESFQSPRDWASQAALLGEPPTRHSGQQLAFTFLDYSRLGDTGLNREGRMLGTLTGVDRLENWEDLSEEDYRARKSAWQAQLLERLEGCFPGIGSAIVFQEFATARTMAKYLNTPGGAVYGFNPSPGEFRPPKAATPIPGLYLASAFGAMGGGFTGAMLSGEQAAKEVLALW